MSRSLAMLLIAAVLVMAVPGFSAAEPTTYSVGVAQVDITPDYPVRLSGFGFRKTESEGITQPIWAKALAISTSADSQPVVVITVDNLGIPASMSDIVAKRLEAQTGLPRARFAVCASHTHTAPMLRGVAPTLFGQPITDEHQQHINRYSDELTNHLEAVALAALKDRQPSRLNWGIGSVKFAINRRTKGGPVDLDLPVMVVKRMDGTVRAIFVNYACHCVTLSNNKISGDWAGYAQDLIQREFPSSIAMVSIGCGADQNPSSGVTGDKTDIALQQGAEIAAEVKRLTGGFLAPVTGEIAAEWKSIPLEFDTLPTRAEWEERAKRQDALGHHARVNLMRLDHGEELQTKLNYPIASWKFGDALAMVFLPGEVVVDYSLRLKRELDGRRLWVNAYSNDEPCYIPSERVLKEGGYEALNAMYYYDRPTSLKAGLEDAIIGVVHEQLDAKFAAPFDGQKTSGTTPKSPQQSLALMQTTPNLRVDLVVAEPLIADPVAIDFGADGALWVAEMGDYPYGPEADNSNASQEGKRSDSSGGRVRLVRDTDGDGQFDRSTIFLDGLPLPTGVTVWRDGVLICAAPDILFARDTDGDDKADVVQKLYTGFGTSNNQARLNSLVYGVDGWIYGSCGLFGGTITNAKGVKYELGDRDFRIKPDTGEIEPATGRTQQGRVRDDFDNWFGCDNTNLGYHYPVAEHYLRRNPYIGSPPSRVNVAQKAAAAQLFPARGDAQRFQLSGPPGTTTAACGVGVYRDSLLGDEYSQNLFVCEPVNLLVHRMPLKSKGSSFEAERAANEQGTEFLRSSDGWFRPVQAITGPDGNLWVVDMYRFIIEDPRWIPEHELAPLDVHAGSTMGRIYRVSRADNRTPPATRFDQARNEPAPAQTQQFLGAVYHEWDIQRMERATASGDKAVPTNIIQEWRAASVNGVPSERVIHLRKLDVAGKLTIDDVRNALGDADSRIRAFAVALAERSPFNVQLLDAVIQCASDADSRVRLQAACSLGEWVNPKVGATLAAMALRDADDPYIVAAIFSSLGKDNLQAFTTKLFSEVQGNEPPPTLMAPFLATAVGVGDDAAIKLALVAVTRHGEGWPKLWQLTAMSNLVESLSHRSVESQTDPAVTKAIEEMQDQASVMAVTETLDESVRVAAIKLMGRDPVRLADDMERLEKLLTPANPPSVQTAAVATFERLGTAAVPGILAAHFRDVSPNVQPRIVDTLLSRGNWIPLLFDQIAGGAIPASSITPEQRQELVGHPTASIRERATELLAANLNPDRQQVIQQYHDALTLKGTVERGQALFARNCSQCHRLNETGHAVGPNLAMVANKTPSFILQELLDPNRNVDTRYVSYVAVTKEGLIRTGLLASESSASVTLRGAEGKQFTLLRSELEELRATGKSLMPEGLEKDLPPQAIADIIAFLGAVPSPAKTLDGNQPTLVKATEGGLVLSASSASICGDQITYERPFENIGYWHGMNDHVSWTVETPQAGQFDVYLEGACDDASAGNPFRIEIGDTSLKGQIETTGGWDRFRRTKVGTVSLAEGAQRIVMRPEGLALRGALVDLKALYFVPAGQALALAQTTTVESPAATASGPDQVAAKILDDKLSEAERTALIASHADDPASLVVSMTRGMPNDAKEEYRRIPWIWRVAVACGKRAQSEQLVKLLEVSLPKEEQPLRDWEAVVIGGGIINGIGLKGDWPGTRLKELLRDQPDLAKRFSRLLKQAAEMADNEKVTTGTRYDALRIIALDDWKVCQKQLTKYLSKGVHDELQMGAISGLSDVEGVDTAGLLIDHVGHFNEENRGIAIAALLRTEARAKALLKAIQAKKVPDTFVNAAQRETLRGSQEASIREQAIQLFGK